MPVFFSLQKISRKPYKPTKRNNFKLIYVTARLALAWHTCLDCPLGQRYVSKRVTKLWRKLGRNYVKIEG